MPPKYPVYGRRPMKTPEDMYGEIVASEVLKAKFAEAAREDKVLEFLSANGCQATDEEAKAFLQAKREVAVDELDDISGGCDHKDIAESIACTGVTWIGVISCIL